MDKKPLFLNIGKAYQRVIREKKEEEYKNNKIEINSDIKNSVCREISPAEAKKIILEYEWLGKMGSTYMHYGLFFDDILSCAICFGQFQAPEGYKYYVGEKYAASGIQLSRGACAYWAHPHSGSKLIGYGLREMKKKGFKYVIAFSDEDAGEIGTIYQATNWIYLGKRTEKVCDYRLVYKDTKKTFCDTRDMLKRLGFRGVKKGMKFIEQNPHLEMCFVKPKARYIKLLGNKKENKEMMDMFKDKILPYPKRSIEI